MPWSQEELARVADLAFSQKGKDYRYGAKPSPDDKDPGSFDCSGFVRWVIAQGRDHIGNTVLLPHGSFEQIKVCRALVREPRVMDLGFADLNDPGGVVDHVVLKINDFHVIEARGKPYNSVIIRPIFRWEEQRGFLGWWTVKGVWEA